MTAPETAAQNTTADAGITVRVESFVGPLDLLLHLCRTNEMDLSRLSLRAITDQYLTHLEAVRFQDLETAGSFMVMAATLIYLKSKLLLPANPDDPEEALDEEGELLKRELEERLREYARVKALGAWLSEREAEQSLVYGRTTADLPPPEDIPLEDLSVHLLQRAMQRLIEDQKRRVPRQVEPNPLSVLERMGEITDLLRSTWSLLFSSVAGAERLRAEWVVTLLALLELVRLGQARARQAELFGEIVIERHAVSVREPVREVEFDEVPLDGETLRDGPAATEAPAEEATAGAEGPRDGVPDVEPRAAMADATAADATADVEATPPTAQATEPARADAVESPETASPDDRARTEEGEPRNA